MISNSSPLLINESPLQVLPSLAVALGNINEAIILQQIQYWLKNPKSGRLGDDGRKYIRDTVSEWNIQFPWLTERAIKTRLKSLKDKKIILTANLNKLKYDRTNWYSIDYDALNKLMQMHSEETFPWKVKKLHYQKGRNFTIESEETSQPIPKTSSKTSSETSTKKYIGTAQDAEPPIPYKEIVDYLNQKTGAKYKATTKPTVKQITKEFEFIWDKYPKKKGKKVAYSHYKAWRKTNPAHNTPQYLIKRLNAYIQHLTKDHTPEQYVLNGSTWFNGRFDDVLDVDKVQAKHGGFDKRLFENTDANTDDLPF